MTSTLYEFVFKDLWVARGKVCVFLLCNTSDCSEWGPLALSTSLLAMPLALLSSHCTVYSTCTLVQYTYCTTVQLQVHTFYTTSAHLSFTKRTEGAETHTACVCLRTVLYCTSLLYMSAQYITRGDHICEDVVFYSYSIMYIFLF